MSDALQASVNHAIKILNEAVQSDPGAMNKLFNTRIDCNDKLADHSTIQVRCYDDNGDEIDQCSVGLLGMINGIFGKDDNGYSHICAVVDPSTWELQRFAKTSEMQKVFSHPTDNKEEEID